MTAPLLELLASARRAGLIFTGQADGQLVIRGPRRHEQLVRSLLARKPDVLTVLAAYTGEVTGLDWRHVRVLNEPRLCALCGRPALLFEPYDQRPCHKVCAEAAIRWGTIPAVRVRQGRAA